MRSIRTRRLPHSFPRPRRAARSVAVTLALLASLAGLGCRESSSATVPPDRDGDGALAANDCDDGDPLVQTPRTYHVDGDEDGTGGDVSEELCEAAAPPGYSALGGDCDDADPDVQAVESYHVDGDGDGIGGPAIDTLCASTPPAGYSRLAGDCDDADPGVSDEAPYFVDADDDGFGAGDPILLCSAEPPSGHAANADDPDDANPAAVPDDRDGDGVANTGDCAPDDSSAYVLQTYYTDVDGDGLGADPMAFCVALPAPDRSGYVSNDLDSCPAIPDMARDLDEDGVDDACDTDIHIVSSYKILTEDVHLPHRIPATQEVIRYRLGSETDRAYLGFEGASLTVEDCVALSIEGGSALVFETRTWGEPATLRLGTPAGSSDGCETTIRGAHAPPPPLYYRNLVRFRGGALVAGRRAAFRGLDALELVPILLRNPDGVAEYYGADLRNEGAPGDDWEPEEHLTIAESTAGSVALFVRHQFLDLRNVRFVDNGGYPLKCKDHDYRLRPGTTLRGVRHRRGTCQLAMLTAYFEGNRYGGPLLWLSDAFDSDLAFPNEYSLDPDLQPTPEHGTRTLYVQGLWLGSGAVEVDSTVRFADVDLLAHRYTPVAAPGGPEPEEVFGRDVEIRVHGGEHARAIVRLESVHLAEVPIHLWGSRGHVDATDSVLGRVLIDARFGDPFGPGGSLIVRGSLLDFPASPFDLLVRGLDEPFVDLTAGIVFNSRQLIDPGSVTIVDSTIVSDASIDHPILYRSERDPTGRIVIDEETVLQGTTAEDLIRLELDEGGNTVEAWFHAE